MSDYSIYRYRVYNYKSIVIDKSTYTTVYPRSEAAATNCFTLQIKEATIRGPGGY